MKQKQVVIVGGGASGIAAAITAAREGAKVVLIEQKDRLGKKILSTGNGKCNLTNEYMKEECFRSDNMEIVSSVLKQFGYQETITFFEKLGVLLKSRQGYIYPITDQASTILDVLCMEIARLKVEVRLNTSVQSISYSKKGYLVKTNTDVLQGDAVILATGGKAAAVLGSDGSGYSLAKSFGHHISPVVPALVQLKGKGNFFKQVSGVRTNAKVSAYVEGTRVSEDTGELQMTNYGISGIPVFQISRYIAKALYAHKKAKVEVDFLPTMTDFEFFEFLNSRLTVHNDKTAEEFFTGIFNQKLIGLFLKISRIDPKVRANSIAKEQLELFIKVSKHFFVEIEGTNDFDQAQICAGGILTSEVNHQTLESNYAPDLYITGELLDVDGICGGYNLQWAWATGYIAGLNAAKGK